MSTRLSRADRRAQLLDAAHALVREHGTDALTLATLAERSGVSKPLVYGHFETRSGLMMALCDGINQRQLDALAAALTETPPTLGAVARLLATVYLDCHVAVGPEWHAIAAVLRGSAEMDAYQREMLDGYADVFCDALAPLTTLPAETVRRRCVGIIGAAEAISDDVVRGRVDRDVAATDLTSLITGWLAPRPEGLES